MENMTMDKMVNFCKQYGFIFQGSEIYGGLANTWDYGPLGREVKENIKKRELQLGLISGIALVVVSQLL